MKIWPFYSADELRAMYEGGRADRTARRLARVWARVFALGLMPKRWVTLEVRGRRTGLITRFPLGMARCDGQWYLVAMLGDRCNWVRNVRQADGLAVLCRRRPVACRLTELPVSERAPIIRSYLQQVPGARPHIPVSRTAALEEFETIAPRYPVFRVDVQPTGQPASSTRSLRTTRGKNGSKKHHWLRWALVGLILVVIIAVAGVAFSIKQPAPAPFKLPAAAAAPSGPLAGAWQVTAGSAAGFRIRETAIGFSNDVVGRTTAVTGTIVVAGNTVASAKLVIHLNGITLSGKSQRQVGASLGTSRHPVAMFTLTRPVILSPAFLAGQPSVITAPGELAMHGISRQVTVTLTGRRDGSELEAAGSIPVSFASWSVRGPAGFGFFGSLADHGIAEFLVLLHRS